MIRLLIQNELLPLSKARTVFRRSLDYAFIPEGWDDNYKVRVSFKPFPQNPLVH